MRRPTTDRYPVYVDISAKIESWTKPSVIAVANGHMRTLIIYPEVKMAAARLIDSPEPVQFTLMAALTFLTVRPYLDRVSSITLDRDYSGEVAERRILGRLLAMIRREMPTFKKALLRIDNVEGTRADIVAREVYRRMRRPDGKISLSDIEGVL